MLSLRSLRRPRFQSRRTNLSLRYGAFALAPLGARLVHPGDVFYPPSPERGNSYQLPGSTAKSSGRAIATMLAATEREHMKIKRLMALIVGITSVALSPMTATARGGGGGGGGHGGGFGGGGFGGGGFH